MILAIREQIGVSTEQAAKIRQQEADFHKTAIRSRADLQTWRRSTWRELMSADKPITARRSTPSSRKSARRDLRLEKSAVNFRLDSPVDALTADQRQKLRDLMRNRRGRDGGPGERGPRGGRQGGLPRRSRAAAQTLEYAPSPRRQASSGNNCRAGHAPGLHEGTWPALQSCGDDRRTPVSRIA